MVRIAIDRGGTFTDVYALYEGKVYVEKLLSQSPHYEDANSEGVRRILKKIFDKEFDLIPNELFAWVRLGTTVATNALLERKGAKVTLAITEGFGDLLRIGDQRRPELFALHIQKPKPLYERVVELPERVIPGQRGFEVLKSMEKVKIEGEGSLAVVCLHSYGFLEHERRVEAKGFGYVARSSEVMSVVGALARAQSAVVDAYLTPVVKSYVEKIVKNFQSEKNIFFIKSDGTLCSPKEFRGINSLLSGPAGGVVALKSLYEGKPLIGFDMGGTSTDVSRYDGELELRYSATIEGQEIAYPMVDIHTVAAGGGSRLFFKNGMFVVGPESSGSDPGPLCYGRGGYLSVSDANLVTGRLQAGFMPKIFGKGNEPLDMEVARRGFEPIAKEVGRSIEEVAEAFLEVANEQMANAVKEITIKKGFDPKEHVLCCFGGAGGQHAVGVARRLGIEEIIIHRHSGILSAVGIAHAKRSQSYIKALDMPLEEFDERLFEEFPEGKRSLLLRYEGTNTAIEVEYGLGFEEEFRRRYKRRFGFLLQTRLVVQSLKVEVSEEEVAPKRQKIGSVHSRPTSAKLFMDGKWQDAKVYKEVGAGQRIEGPAIILQEASTIVLDSASEAFVNEYGDVRIRLFSKERQTVIPAAKLSLLANRFSFVATKMGDILQKAAISTNIKERYDFSCAIFDAKGRLVTNAPHIPVHLGSMSSVVQAVIEKFGTFEPNESFITNVPYEGGSHLPDITIVTPYVEDGEVRFWVASRGHHADIGGAVPGSMPPFSMRLDEEGARIEAFRIVQDGVFDEERLREILQRAGARRIEDNISDIRAQLAANQEGIAGVLEIEEREWFFEEIIAVSRKRVEEFFENLTAKEAVDYLDNGAAIRLRVYKEEKVIFDFSGSSYELLSNQNTPPSVVRSAVLYAVRVMIEDDIPLNEGLLEPIEIRLPKASLLSPSKEAAVVGGNVTTSQRIVDVIFKAFEIAAASQGCMNNVIIGDESFGYYETIAGGAGATPMGDGASGVHTHMTNTKITDVEVAERRYPFMIERFALRQGSGGEGKFLGGDGVERVYRFLKPLEVSVLSERRSLAPYGLRGGSDGKRGENLLCRDGRYYNLGGKVSLRVQRNDRLIIKTPGGGGWGRS
ncbi:MAG: 5-oxoprolinase [Epsilonproteobacteria bacterium]|nr:5-oxoprolinase [Campylobacterota bacterium]NPA64726.1 5-oxoprolinase [Campylobacterota bacterium]